PKAGGHIDGGAIGQRYHGADAGGRHQTPTHVIVPHDGQQAAMQDAELLAKYPPDNEQRFDQHSQIREVLDKLLDTRLELHRPHHAHLEAKVTQRTAQVVLNGDGLRLQQLAMGQQHALFLTAQCFHMHRTIKPRPHHLRHPARVVAVGLVDLRLQYRPHVPRLDTDRRQARFSESTEKPLRQWPGFQPDPLEVVGGVPQHRHQRLGFARHLDFPNDPARVIHNADAGLLDRQIQSSKMVHAALLLLMLEAVHTDLVFTISLKRSTQNLQLSTSSPADYPIFGSRAERLLPSKSRPLFAQMQTRAMNDLRVCFVPGADSAASVDYLVGALLKMQRHFEAERLARAC